MAKVGGVYSTTSAMAARAISSTFLDDLGLVPALEAYVEQWSERIGVPTSFAAIRLPEERLHPLVETVIYRVVQEALNNIAKYAAPYGATHFSVTLQRLDGHVQATVEDDGPGFDVEEALCSGRLGLLGMRERAELIGGTLEIESTPGKGTTVFLRVPLSSDSGSHQDSQTA